jgi:hypothetical protein
MFKVMVLDDVYSPVSNKLLFKKCTVLSTAFFLSLCKVHRLNNVRFERKAP